MRRVLIIYSGGTIGMRPSDHGYIPMIKFNIIINKTISTRNLDNFPIFEVIECHDLIDSSNLHPNHWTGLAQLIINNLSLYDGFVLLHGTDTMAYTASMLSYMLLGINKPVILTGSQIPMIEPRTDAIENLITAVLLAGHYNIPEVCIYFANRLLRGNRSTKVKSVEFDAFDSPNFPWLGTIGINIDIKHQLLLSKRATLKHPANFDPNAVAIFRIYPGISVEILKAVLQSPSLKGLVLQTYGAGNPPDANKTFINLLEEATDQNILLLNVSQCYQGIVNQGSYATGATLNRIGVISGADLTVEAAFTKLHFLLSQNDHISNIRQAVVTPIAGEITPTN